MGLRITTLSENSAIMGDFLAEWGLSILVETGDATILLDAGRSLSASHNAASLKVDPDRIDKIVLSHGHHDHTGGLHALLRQRTREIEIIAHPAAWAPKYSRRQDKDEKFIGIPYAREELESLGARFSLTNRPVEVSKDIITTGEIPMATAYEQIDSALFVKQDVWKPDRVEDDLALIIKTGAGLVVVLGCAHRGIINTLYHARKLTGVSRIYAVIGGSHLFDSIEERLWQTIAALKELDVKKLGLCHCTGPAVASVLRQEFGERFFFNNAGTTVEL